jgi:hypothetical protein
MKHRDSFTTIAISSVAVDMNSIAQGDLVGSYTIGTGASTSYLQFEFANSNAYLYEVRYDGSLRGDDLFAIVATAQPGFFSYQVASFSFGDALVGVTIGADANEGFGTPPDYVDYWHYWTRESADANWTNSMIGFAVRTISDGSWDGWVFNSNAQPASVPVPACGAIMVSTILTVRRRRR